ncbi:hypothetical protein Efla_007044 [Eimeria flavescens]
MNRQAPASSSLEALGVARIKDKCLLGFFTSRIPSKRQTELSRHFVSGLQLVKPVGSARSKQEAAGVFLFFQVDPSGEFVYGALISDASYPERVAYQLLTEFQNGLLASVKAEKLRSACSRSLERMHRGRARDLMRKYGDASAADPTRQVLRKVESVKVVVDANIKKVLENHGSLQQLASRTDSLSDAAKEFNKEATNVRTTTWKQKMGLTIVVAVLLAAILGYMIFVLVRLVT